MIDFRYHLVSLVSVFLALAVGIVLGAGPLKGSIGDTLTESVEQLRKEKDALRGELNTANDSVAHRDDFVTRVAPELLIGELTGRAVVLVTLPGVDSADTDAVVQAVDTAGGTVTGQVAISANWVAADAAQAREKALGEIVDAAPGGTAPVGSVEEKLDAYLARALVGTGAGLTGRTGGSTAKVVDRLTGADLIDVDGDLAALAGSALVLAPAVDTATDADAAAPATPAAGDATQFLALVSALDAAGGGTVVSGPPSSAGAGGLVSAVRDDDDLAENVSTVDTGATPMGVLTAVLALHEQVGGGVGQYGFADGASDPLPAAGASTS